METAFTKDLDKVIEAGLVKRTDGRLYIPVYETSKFKEMTINDVEFNTRVYKAIARMYLHGQGTGTPLPDVLADLIKIKKLNGVGVEALKSAKTQLFSIMYSTMTVTEKQYFWCDFISANDPELWKEAKAC